jgi:hypothetical protein
MSPTKATKKPATPAAAKKPAEKLSTSPVKASAPAAAHQVAADKKGASASPAGKSVDKAPEKMPDAPSEPGAVTASNGEADAKKDKAPSALEKLAQELILANEVPAVVRHLAALDDEREAPSTHAARLLSELAELKPELLVSMIERFARLLVSKNKRVVQSAAAALAPLSRIAPAKVAKQLPLLTQNWAATTEEGKDGLVRTFAGLCTASVAYQKRLEPALAQALGEAEPKLLIRWTEIVLPALKGEPHARARAVVESRLANIPRPQAQKIADFLGIKLRPIPRS